VDYISLILVFISSVIFVITFFLAAGQARLQFPERRTMNPKRDYGIAGEKNAIVVQLPKGLSLLDDYTLDLKLSLRRDEKVKTEVKQENAGGGEKKYRHRLDEYL
jgi:hypothetical protein